MYVVGSVRLKKPYFSSKRESALVFISNCSSYCKDHISAETQANFNLAHVFFCPHKMLFWKVSRAIVIKPLNQTMSKPGTKNVNWTVKIIGTHCEHALGNLFINNVETQRNLLQTHAKFSYNAFVQIRGLLCTYYSNLWVLAMLWSWIPKENLNAEWISNKISKFSTPLLFKWFNTTPSWN